LRISVAAGVPDAFDSTSEKCYKKPLVFVSG